MSSRVTLGFHAEALQDDRVWGRVALLIEKLHRHGLSATFFVYPFPSAVEGVDITARVRALLDAGQEVGQHSHFYAGDRIGKGVKRNDLSDANVVHCIRRDLEYLEGAGSRPEGFVAGAWHINPAVLDEIAARGFRYDCSARVPKPGATKSEEDWEWLEAPTMDTRTEGSVLRLPTLCTLGEWFKGGRRRGVGGSVPFRSVYLHDYDLLRPRVRVMLRVWLRMNGRHLMSSGDLADHLTKQVDR